LSRTFGAPLDKEFAEAIEKPKIRIEIFDPKELPHFVKLKEYVFVIRSYDEIETSENEAHI
jgi:hypothetical protein